VAGRAADPSSRSLLTLQQPETIAKERSMFKEFKEFAMRGNVVDMAVGIIIGGAFGTIVKSLVNDVMMPPLGLLLGGVDFTNFFVVGRRSCNRLLTRNSASAAATAPRSARRCLSCRTTNPL
jgi:hypothetical protein